MVIHVITACHNRKKTTQRLVKNLKDKPVMILNGLLLMMVQQMELQKW